MPSPSFVHQLRLETVSRLVELTVARIHHTKALVFDDEGKNEDKNDEGCVSLFFCPLGIGGMQACLSHYGDRMRKELSLTQTSTHRKAGSF